MPKMKAAIFVELGRIVLDENPSPISARSMLFALSTLGIRRLARHPLSATSGGRCAFAAQLAVFTGNTRLTPTR